MSSLPSLSRRGHRSPSASRHGCNAIPAPDASITEYEALLLRHLPWVEATAGRVARLNGMSPTRAQDFVADVVLRLIERDYAVLRQFRRQCTLTTFLTVVINRLYLDARIEEWGKWRPSARGRRAGECVVEFERLVSRDGLPFDQACSILRARGHAALDENALLEHYARMRRGSRLRFVDMDALAQEPSSHLRADALVARREATHHLSRAAKALDAAFRRMPAEDRMLLTRHFRDALAVAAIAGATADQKRLYRRVASALRRLRKALAEDGVDGTDVLPLLGAAEVATPAISSWAGSASMGSATRRLDRAKTDVRVA